jgi:hypothetical protein
MQSELTARAGFFLRLLRHKTFWAGQMGAGIQALVRQGWVIELARAGDGHHLAVTDEGRRTFKEWQGI